MLGANDGIVSTASLVIGVAAASGSSETVMMAGVAGLVAGAMSMAAGEFVSVSSQRDAERAEIELERRELREDPGSELRELAQIYCERGVEPEIARIVAEQMTAHDALSAHARDELGINDHSAARPALAAMASGVSFAAGAALPLAIAWTATGESLSPAVGFSSIVTLAGLGAAAARMGGAVAWVGSVRVCAWGSLAMLATAAVGRVFGVA